MKRRHLSAYELQHSNTPILQAPGSWLVNPGLTPALKISDDRSNLRL